MDSARGERDPLVHSLGDPARTSDDQPDEKGSRGTSGASSAGFRRLLSGSSVTLAATAGKHKKNLLVLSLAFLLNFTAFSALQNLQASLHAVAGVASLAVIYGGLIVSCLLAPAVIRALAAKWTLAVGFLCYAAYTAANYAPSVYTLLPAGLLLGLAGGPLWAAQGTYLTTTAVHYADATAVVPEGAIQRFNGVFFCIFQASQVTGNLVASLVLFPAANVSSPAVGQQCGLHVCGSGLNSQPTDANVRPETTKVLVSVYLACGLLSVALVCLFLGRLGGLGDGPRATLAANLAATLRLLANPHILLLVPLFVYTGIEQAFIFSDFTKAYITCSNGVHYVGFIMVAFGLTDAVCSGLFGQLEKYTSRVVIVTVGALAHGLVLAILLAVPSLNDPHTGLWDLFALAAAWGVGDAVWQTQTASIIGVIFHEDQEPAFSNFRLFQAVGFCVYFALSTVASVCVLHKIIALGLFLIVSLVLYYTVEWKIRRANSF